MSKFIAIGSGKGGVGKSTTTINIALSLVAMKMRVAIADLDPLSNIATILDVASDGDKTAGNVAGDMAVDAIRLEDITMPYIDNCDILFPDVKAITSMKRTAGALFGTLRKALAQRYDIVLIDMPAGIAEEFYIDLMPYIRHLIVVVVPEPPAHISAAGFAKAAMQINPLISVYFWHNKFRSANLARFNAYTVIENYHRYVGEGERFTPRERARCRDIAYIPREQILDLLRSSFQPHECVWFKIRGTLAFFYELQIQALVGSLEAPAVVGEYLTHYIIEHRVRGDMAEYVERAARSFEELRRSGVLSEAGKIDERLRARLTERLRGAMGHPFFRAVAQCIEKIDDTLQGNALAEATRRERHIQVLENRVAALLQLLDGQREQASKSIRRCAALLSVYLSFSKLLRNETVRRFMLSRIPTRRERGRVVRDRRQQIAHLIQKDRRLQDAHVGAIRQIYPLVIRQMMAVNKRYRLSSFNLIMTRNNLAARAYLQLVSHIIHEIIHCGLGVVIGIPMSRTYISTQKGSERVKALVA